jgi:hypothetical protein
MKHLRLPRTAVWAILALAACLVLWGTSSHESLRSLPGALPRLPNLPKLPPKLLGMGTDTDAHRQYANLRWPQWRVGAGDSPDDAARRRWELARATQHAGTGARVQRFLEKAKRGEPFTVAAIGGSGA